MSNQIWKEQLEMLNTETVQHVANVSVLCIEFAKLMKYSDDEGYMIQNVARFHDIGKSVIPNHILDKPTKLTDKEFELVKTHSVEGERILRIFGFDDELELSIVRGHHEKYDGSGYPDGLVGEEIPKLARLLNLIDVFEAIASKRVYKKAWNKDKVYTFMKDNQIFDPKMLKIFIENFDYLYNIIH